MNQIKCLLFDLDGTLLDSRDSVIDAVYHTSEKYMPGRFTRNDLLKRFGESFEDFLQENVHLIHRGISREEILATYFEYLEKNHDEKVRLFPRVKDCLEQLKSTGVRLEIVTNKQRDFTLQGLRLGQIDHLFDGIVTLDDVSKGKPSAEPILIAMDQLGVRPRETWMIGDSRYDVLAARSANVKCAVLEWYGEVEWADVVPDYRFADLAQLVEKFAVVETR